MTFSLSPFFLSLTMNKVTIPQFFFPHGYPVSPIEQEQRQRKVLVGNCPCTSFFSPHSAFLPLSLSLLSRPLSSICTATDRTWPRQVS
jgi:hypothetical protein